MKQNSHGDVTASYMKIMYTFCRFSTTCYALIIQLSNNITIAYKLYISDFKKPYLLIKQTINSIKKLKEQNADVLYVRACILFVV